MHPECLLPYDGLISANILHCRQHLPRVWPQCTDPVSRFRVLPHDRPDHTCFLSDGLLLPVSRRQRLYSLHGIELLPYDWFIVRDGLSGWIVLCYNRIDYWC